MHACKVCLTTQVYGITNFSFLENIGWFYSFYNVLRPLYLRGASFYMWHTVSINGHHFTRSSLYNITSIKN